MVNYDSKAFESPFDQRWTECSNSDVQELLMNGKVAIQFYPANFMKNFKVGDLVGLNAGSGSQVGAKIESIKPLEPKDGWTDGLEITFVKVGA